MLLQDCQPIKVIIVDDGSTDETLAVTKALEEQHPDIFRVTYFRDSDGTIVEEPQKNTGKII